SLTVSTRLTNSGFLVKESGKQTTLTAALTMPVPDTLLRHGEEMLSSPHDVTLVLGALQFVPLEHLIMEVYHTTFESIHEALFAVIQCLPQVSGLGSIHFNRQCLAWSSFLKALLFYSPAPETDAVVLLKCTRLVERMYSHTATTAEGFTILSSFMAAQYVSELQKVTLQPDFKRHLTEGVYRILDLCVEQEVRFLNNILQMGLREVFNEIYGSYTYYHKTQWQGEEKYTAWDSPLPSPFPERLSLL
uniref:Nucleolar 27S pre-rRNA processing Urb2/Npa2 C-terminal domain-containing protein n=1 Tax=Oncorhynchus tshawytscha TaxID=74940 RepID=A0AAZ3QJU8_ONCTS